MPVPAFTAQLPDADGAAAVAPARRIRVAEVLTGLVLGGVGRIMTGIARHVDRSRFHVDFYCVIERGVMADELEALGFNVTVLPACDYQRLFQYRAGEMLRLVRLLKQRNYDVVHTHLFQADLLGRAAAHLAGVPGVVKTLHNMGRSKTRWQRAADRVLGRWTQWVICVSEHQRQEALRHEPLPPERVIVIPNGVDVGRFSPRVDRRAELARRGLAGEGPVVGTVGRLIEEKGQIHFLRAIPLVLQRHPAARFVIVGDGPLRGRLEGFLDDKPYRDRVRITGLRQDVPELLSLMDVFVFPSLSEGFPIAPIEAMAARRPVAGSRIPQLDGVVVDGQTGLSFPPGDTAAMAESICRLLGDTALCDRLSRKAFELVRDRYSERRMVQELELVYERLAAGAGASPSGWRH